VIKQTTKKVKNSIAQWLFTSVTQFTFFVVLFCVKDTSTVAQNIAIGEWESHFNYLSAHQLAITENRTFCASHNGLFSVNLSGSDLRTYGKQDGLSETGVSSMAYDSKSKTLLLTYRSGNIDLLFLTENDELENVTAWPVLLSASDLPDKKNIVKAVFHDDHAYLATNFGIVILDVNLRQVLETYRYIGSNGAEVQVKDIAFTADSIFALTSQGLQASTLNPTVNRQYFANWKTVPSPVPVASIVSQENALYAGLPGKGVYQYSNAQWKPVFPNPSQHYSLSKTITGIGIVLDDSYVSLSSPDNTTTINTPLILAPNQSAEISKNVVWITDSKNGLLSNVDGTLKAYNPIQKDTTIFQRTDSVVIDQSGLNWARLPSYLAGGILVRDANTNRERYLNSGTNSGALPSSTINSLTVDQDGYIWFASDRGIGYIFPDEILTTASVTTILPIYGQRKLFANERCTAIAVESGNRKWIGTRSGLYLFSADGTELVNHFTATNSPLPSDIISSLRFEPESGLLFIDTPNGMVSYRTNSIASEERLSNINIFPNPVRPGYSGQVGIKGLTDNSTVKITQLSGRLVHETRSEGGLASWNLNDYTGKRAKGGIYVIYVVSKNGNQKIAGKLAIID
jgi:hypothetical protein